MVSLPLLIPVSCLLICDLCLHLSPLIAHAHLYLLTLVCTIRTPALAPWFVCARPALALLSVVPSL